MNTIKSINLLKLLSNQLEINKILLKRLAISQTFFIQANQLWSKTFFLKKHLKNQIKIKLRYIKNSKNQAFKKLTIILFSKRTSNAKKLSFLMKLTKRVILSRLIQSLILAIAIIPLWACKMIKGIARLNIKAIADLIHLHFSRKSKNRKKIKVSITNKIWT